MRATGIRRPAHRRGRRRRSRPFPFPRGQREAAVPTSTGVMRDAYADDALRGGGEGGGEHGAVEGVAAFRDDHRGCGDDDAGSVRRLVGLGDVVRLLRIERGDPGTQLPEPVGELHYLTAPAVMPRVRVRWKMRKKMSVGMMPSSAEALVGGDVHQAVALEHADGDWNRLIRIRGEERQRDEELVPRPDEEEDQQDRERGTADREDHSPQDLPAARTVERRGLQHLLGERAVDGREQVGAERRLDDGEDDDDRPHVSYSPTDLNM